MTSYHGGKQRIGKRLAEIIACETLDIEETEGFAIRGYCEPFAGMLGVYQHIPDYFEDHQPRLTYKAGEINKSVVMMWKDAQRGWKPPTRVSDSEYFRLKEDNRDSALKGYVAHQYSFGGIFFGGYAPKYGKNKDSSKASNKIQEIAEKLRNVSIRQGSYTQFSNLREYIIYCDPPYVDTTKRYQTEFDDDLFWDWCRDMVTRNNIVYVSGYKAPRDFECIFSSSHKLTGMSPGKNKKRVEKLFLLY